MRKYKQRSLYYAVVITTVVGLVLVAASFPSIRRLARLSTSHQPERFSELYFLDHATLVKKITPGKIYDGQFVIVNHEARPTQYSYEIQVTENGKPTMLSRSNVSVPDGQPITLPFHYSGRYPGSSLEVKISLLNKPELIRFRANTPSEQNT